MYHMSGNEYLLVFKTNQGFVSPRLAFKNFMNSLIKSLKTKENCRSTIKLEKNVNKMYILQ